MRLQETYTESNLTELQGLSKKIEATLKSLRTIKNEKYDEDAYALYDRYWDLNRLTKDNILLLEDRPLEIWKEESKKSTKQEKSTSSTDSTSAK